MAKKKSSKPSSKKKVEVVEQPVVKEELVEQKVKVQGFVAKRDINLQFRKGDSVPEEVVARWKKSGLKVSELIE